MTAAQLMQLACPACGGALEPPDGGIVVCPFCEARALVSQGGLQKLSVFQIPEVHGEADLRPPIEARLRNAGFDKAPELTATETPIRYLMRRGRVRTRPIARQSGNHGIAKQHEEVREGLFGIPLASDDEHGLLVLEDIDALQPVDSAVPDDLADELMRFPDLVERALEDNANERIFERTKPLRLSFSHIDVSATWTDDVYVVDVPVTTFSFSDPELPAGMMRKWTELNADGHYAIVVDRHTGSTLRFEAPSKGYSGLMVLLILGALIGVPTLAIAATTILIPLALTFGTILLGGLMSLLGA